MRSDEEIWGEFTEELLSSKPKRRSITKTIKRIGYSIGHGIKELLTIGIVLVLVGGFFLLLFTPILNGVFGVNPIQIIMNSPTSTSINESKADIEYINRIRIANGVNPIKFDNRVYNIAVARVNDMDAYGYMDHTNPKTGTCAFSLKSQFGLGSGEYVAENAYGYESSSGNYHDGIEKNAIDDWMTSRGHKYNLLYPHTAGAVACSKGGHCVFLGLNYARFGEGCHTGAEGLAYWNSVGRQQYEH